MVPPFKLEKAPNIKPQIKRARSIGETGKSLTPYLFNLLLYIFLIYIIVLLCFKKTKMEKNVKLKQAWHLEWKPINEKLSISNGS